MSESSPTRTRSSISFVLIACRLRTCAAATFRPFLQKLDTIGDEFEAYPIVFLYRQAFELTLKAIVFAGAVALREEGEEPMPLQRIMKHELTPLFRELCRIVDAMGADDEGVFDLQVEGLRTREDFAVIVREFDEVDRGSYTFRYSIKTDGQTPSLVAGFEFDCSCSRRSWTRYCPFSEPCRSGYAKLFKNDGRRRTKRNKKSGDMPIHLTMTETTSVAFENGSAFKHRRAAGGPAGWKPGWQPALLSPKVGGLVTERTSGLRLTAWMRAARFAG